MFYIRTKIENQTRIATEMLDKFMIYMAEAVLLAILPFCALCAKRHRTGKIIRSSEKIKLISRSFTSFRSVSKIWGHDHRTAINLSFLSLNRILRHNSNKYTVLRFGCKTGYLL
jgi:hypothetical protein